MSKILVVEDDKLLSNAYRLKFTSSGHDVRIAQDGEDALNVMKDFIPDAIVPQCFHKYPTVHIDYGYGKYI